MPTLEEARLWLDHLRNNISRTILLMAKTVIGLGLRADEVLHLRANQLPQLPFDNRKYVEMEISFGTKGKRNPQDTNKRGKQRQILIRTDLLAELHRHRDTHRQLCLKRFRTCHPDQSPPKELFLSKHTGEKFSYKRFYELWKTGPLPYAAFSPHVGRHMWACYTLIEKLNEQFSLLAGSIRSDHPAFREMAANLVRIWIVKQLGHVDEKTTEMYLVWTADAFDIVSHQAQWWDALNGPL